MPNTWNLLLIHCKKLKKCFFLNLSEQFVDSISIPIPKICLKIQSQNNDCRSTRALEQGLQYSNIQISKCINILFYDQFSWVLIYPFLPLDIQYSDLKMPILPVFWQYSIFRFQSSSALVLQIDKRRYTLQNVTTLPDCIRFWSNNVKQNFEVLVWFGILAPFNNFFWSPMFIDVIECNFAEQYIQYRKAELFDDQYSMSHPWDAKDWLIRNP